MRFRNELQTRLSDIFKHCVFGALHDLFRDRVLDVGNPDLEEATGAVHAYLRGDFQLKEGLAGLWRVWVDSQVALWISEHRSGNRIYIEFPPSSEGCSGLAIGGKPLLTSPGWRRKFLACWRLLRAGWQQEGKGLEFGLSLR